MKVFAFGLVFFSVASLSQAYYYNEEGEVESDDGFGSASHARSLYTRSVKSPPPPSPARIKSYNPPSPARARLSAPAPPTKTYQEPQRFEQQTYEQPQSYAPQIQHDVVGRPEPYNFNYDVKDEYGNNQFRKEDSDDTGAVRGSYGYTDANGLYRIVDYVADENGFRASIRTNEPGLVEPSPVTGEVQSPASVTLSAEATPARVREQQLRYTSQSSASSSGSSSQSAYSSSSSLGGGSSSSSPYAGVSQQRLPLRSSGTKY